jgi:hypothetical protein
MRVLGLLLVLAVFLPAACGKQEKETPPLTRDEMVSLMMKVYLAEARTSLLPLPKDSSYRLFLAWQDSLMAKQGVQDSTLRRAYGYYLNHPAELEAIYDAIIDSLTLREQRLF